MTSSAPGTSPATSDWSRHFVAVLVCGVVGLLVVVGGLLGLFALTPTAQRPDLAPLWTAVISGVPALAGAGFSLLVHRKLTVTQQAQQTTLAAQDTKLDTITRQTNGVLTARIREATADAVASALAGRIPNQRATDHYDPVVSTDGLATAPAPGETPAPGTAPAPADSTPAAPASPAPAPAPGPVVEPAPASPAVEALADNPAGWGVPA